MVVGQPHLCAGLNPDHFISCVENRKYSARDKAVVYWLRSGCMHLDRDGPEIVNHAQFMQSAHGFQNLFADVGIISSRNSLHHCVREIKYLPRIPASQHLPDCKQVTSCFFSKSEVNGMTQNDVFKRIYKNSLN